MSDLLLQLIIRTQKIIILIHVRKVVYLIILETIISSHKVKKYIFKTISSRKKEKKHIKSRLNNIISRVHNMDCLLKKIKAMYLKYLFIELRNELSKINIHLNKFDQISEVRNLNITHNRDNFIDLTIIHLLLNNSIFKDEDLPAVMNYISSRPSSLLNKKVKHNYQFDFLNSRYFKNLMRDPVKLFPQQGKIKAKLPNKNCSKFPIHSKNIFSRNQEDYDIYKKLLMQIAGGFIFYFQNNPLKFGKKCKLNFL